MSEEKPEPVYLVFKKDGSTEIPLEKKVKITHIEKYNTE